MLQTMTRPRRSLADPEDTTSRRCYDRWDANRQQDDRETPAERPVTFNSAA